MFVFFMYNKEQYVQTNEQDPTRNKCIILTNMGPHRESYLRPKIS